VLSRKWKRGKRGKEIYTVPVLSRSVSRLN
jgi:hypothetical protein